MLKRPRYSVWVAIFLLAAVVFYLPERAVSSIKMAIGSLFIPLFGLSNTSHSLANKAEGAFIPKKYLLNQIEQLHRENEMLKLQQLQSLEVFKENQRLREYLKYQNQTPQQPWKIKVARVIGRDPSNWWRSLQIDLGSRDGMKPNLTVRTLDGLVGRIAEVGYTRSLVLVMGDPNCRVAVMIQSSKESKDKITSGIIVPSESDVNDNSIVGLTYLSRNSVVAPGQLVETSGMGGLYPKGISVGQIVDVRQVEFGLYQEARVKLAVNFNNLEEVMVILP